MIKKNITVFIPCFNEEKNIPKLVHSWNEAIESNKNISVLFINNGSIDDTLNLLNSEIALTKNNRINYYNVVKNFGYGHGILEGINQVDSEHICWTHADLQFRAKDVTSIIDEYLNSHNNTEVYKGQRNSRFFFDTIFTKLMSVIGLLLKGIYISDINAQPKIFSRVIFSKITDWPIDFSLDAHLLYEIKKKKYSIIKKEIDIMPRIHEEAKGGGTLRGKLKLSISTFKYLIGFYEKY